MQQSSTSTHTFEALLVLEPRVHLSGDVPDLHEFPDAEDVTLEAVGDNGWAAIEFEGNLHAGSDTDVFRFVASPGGTAAVAAVGSNETDVQVVILDDLGIEVPQQGGNLTRDQSESGWSVAAAISDSHPGSVYYAVIGGSGAGDYRLILATLARGGPAGLFYSITGSERTFDRDRDIDIEEEIPEDEEDLECDDCDVEDIEEAPEIILLQLDDDYGSEGVTYQLAEEEQFVFEAPEPGAYRVLVDPAAIDPVVTIEDTRGFVTTSTNPRGVINATLVADIAGQRFNIFVAPPPDAETTFNIRVERELGYDNATTIRTPTIAHPYALYYPEGFSSHTIEEFVPIVNPNDFDVSYELIARYETGERDQVIASGVIDAHSRGGVTITSRRNRDATLVRDGVPYALELRSDAALGATLSHYDFGVTTGEAFTSQLDTQWTFARAERAPHIRDFLVLYNPNAFDTTYTVTLHYQDGTMTSFERTVEAYRRAGVNFTTDSSVTKSGAFGVSVHAERPIIAAVSSYDIVDGQGFGALATAGEGQQRGILPVMDTDEDANASVSVLNRADAPVTIDISARRFRDPDAPAITARFTIDGNAAHTITPEDLQLDPGTDYILEYTSSAPVTLSSHTYRNTEGDGTTTGTEASQTILFADAFTNPHARNQYLERLEVLNPNPEATIATITLFFPDGDVATHDLTIQPGQGRELRIDRLPDLVRRPGASAYSVMISAPNPLHANLLHYDFFLGGGWSSAGTTF